MATKITSHHQSGGVTGHTVTVGGHVQTASAAAPPMSTWKKVTAWTTGAIGLGASVVGILEYVGIKLLS